MEVVVSPSSSVSALVDFFSVSQRAERLPLFLPDSDDDFDRSDAADHSALDKATDPSARDAADNFDGSGPSRRTVLGAQVDMSAYPSLPGSDGVVHRGDSVDTSDIWFSIVKWSTDVANAPSPLFTEVELDPEDPVIDYDFVSEDDDAYPNEVCTLFILPLPAYTPRTERL